MRPVFDLRAMSARRGLTWIKVVRARLSPDRTMSNAISGRQLSPTRAMTGPVSGEKDRLSQSKAPRLGRWAHGGIVSFALSLALCASFAFGDSPASISGRTSVDAAVVAPIPAPDSSIAIPRFDLPRRYSLRPGGGAPGLSASDCSGKAFGPAALGLSTPGFPIGVPRNGLGQTSIPLVDSFRLPPTLDAPARPGLKFQTDASEGRVWLYCSAPHPTEPDRDNRTSSLGLTPQTVCGSWMLHW